MSDSRGFERLYSIVRRLRDPGGCPWDRKQTPETLKSFLLEEAYECIEAIDDKDDEHTKEEIGDLFMLLTMISYMKEQERVFTVDEVLEAISDKLVRRHPHVFGDANISTSDEVVKQWTKIKNDVEGRKDTESILNQVPKNMPPLERAYQLQRRCREVGFDWNSVEGVWEKVREETAELERVASPHASATHGADQGSDASGHHRDIEMELGDLLFSLINLARFLKVDPALALHRANTKFIRRFSHVERRMRESGKELTKENFPIMDAYWEEAKKSET